MFSSINWTSVVCRGVQRLDYETMMVAAVWLAIQRARQRIQKTVCDSTGWPEGAKVTHVEHVYRFYCSRNRSIEHLILCHYEFRQSNNNKKKEKNIPDPIERIGDNVI